MGEQHRSVPKQLQPSSMMHAVFFRGGHPRVQVNATRACPRGFHSFRSGERIIVDFGFLDDAGFSSGLEREAERRRRTVGGRAERREPSVIVETPLPRPRYDRGGKTGTIACNLLARVETLRAFRHELRKLSWRT